MHRLAGACLVGLVLVPAAGAQTPNGPEFQINTYTTGSQWRAALAVDGSGHHVVVFSGPTPGDGWAVSGRRFTSAGVARGPEFRVSSYTTGFRDYPAVASDRAGNFVVTWDSQNQDGSVYGVFGQRFDASGSPVGGEFQVNTFTTGSQDSSAVAMDPAGNFVVVWQDPDGQDGSFTGVFGRRYDVAAGFGPQFRVNAFTTGIQRDPSIAMAADGSFVVAWRGNGPGDSSGIFARRFDSAGAPAGGDFLVNTVTNSLQLSASVSSSPDGAFVVVWQDYLLDGNTIGIFGQRYDGSGNPLGGQFAVNTYTPGGQIGPRVATDADGAFMVTWRNYVPPAIGGDTIRARQFDAAGNAVGGEFGVNSYVTSAQTRPVAAAGPAGQFVVVWQGNGSQDGNEYGVFGQRYGDLVFADTLDSGTVSAWSSAATGGGDLSVSAGAALGGSAFGLQAQVNDTVALYVQDDAPADLRRYRARFYVDPNGFDPGVSQSHLRTRIFIGLEEAPNRRLFAVVLRLQNGQYALMGRARRDDNAQVDTGFFPISDGPHCVEVDWRASSGPDALDGTFEMWIDGLSVSTLAGLDNAISALDFARMGALSVKSGASGTLLFDEFVSRRTEYIGGLP